MPQRLRIMMPSRVAVVATLIAAVIAGGGAAGSVLRREPIYESNTVILIDQPILITRASSEGVVVKLNQLRAKYAVLARTAPIVEPVAQKLGITPGQVGGAIAVSLPGPSLVMVVTGRASKPAVSRDIADAVADQLKAFLAAEQEAAKVPAEERIILSTVAVARPGAKVEPTRGRAVALGAVAALLALVVGFTLSQFRRSRVGTD